MAASSAQISDAVITHRVGLERYSSGVLKKIVKALDRSAVQIEAKILTGLHGAQGDSHVGAISPSAMRQLKETLKVVQGLNAEAHAAMKSELTGGLYDVAAHESQWAHKLYSQGLNVGVNLNTPSAQMLRSAVESAPLRGALIKDWAYSLEAKTYERLSQAITDGVVQGLGVSQIAKAVAEIHPMTARGAEGLVRTAVNHVSNRAHLMYLTENADVFDRYKWVSVLDGRTTPICRARSGKVFDTGKGPVPPAHWRCRSTIAPVIIGEDIDDANAYGKWLDGKSAAEQDEILGRTKGQLYRKGGLPLDKFVKPDGSPLTIEELKVTELKAWKRAGLPTTAADEVAYQQALSTKAKPKPAPAVSVPPTANPAKEAQAAAEVAAKAAAEKAAQAAAEKATRAIKDAAQAAQDTVLAAANDTAKRAVSQAAGRVARAAEADILAAANEAAAKAHADALAPALEAAAKKVDPVKAAKQALANEATVTSSGQVVANGSHVSMPTGISTAQASLSPLGVSEASITAKGTLQSIPIAQLQTIYGNTVDKGLVEKLIESYDPTKPVHVAYYKGAYHLYTGKGPVKAAALLGKAEVQALVLDADALEAAKLAAAKAQLEAAKAAQAAAKAAAEKAAGEAAKSQAQRDAEAAKANASKLAERKAIFAAQDKRRAALGPAKPLSEREGIAAWESWTVTGDIRKGKAAAKAAIKAYSGSTYTEINSFLRGQTSYLSDVNVKRVRDLNALIESELAVMETDAVLWRGSSFNAAEMFVGGLIEDQAFMSWSMREDASHSFRRGASEFSTEKGAYKQAILRQVARKGDRRWIGMHGHTNYENEKEVLTNGSVYRVTKIEKKRVGYEDVTFIDVERVEREDLEAAGFTGAKQPKIGQ